jgi:recombination protein RecR
MNLSKLPGVGKKSASRIAYYLLRQEKRYVDDLASQIRDLKTKIKTCSRCRNYSDQDPCEICGDLSRDGTVICVVEESQDVHTIESTHEYKGTYFVLHGAISPIDGIGPEELKLDRLIRRVMEEPIKEVIVATNPTVEGDTTALYLAKMLKSSGVNLTRLASGLPVGGDLEYAGRLTLTRSLKGRTPFSSE